MSNFEDMEEGFTQVEKDFYKDQAIERIVKLFINPISGVRFLGLFDQAENPRAALEIFSIIFGNDLDVVEKLFKEDFSVNDYVKSIIEEAVVKVNEKYSPTEVDVEAVNVKKVNPIMRFINRLFGKNNGTK